MGICFKMANSEQDSELRESCSFEEENANDLSLNRKKKKSNDRKLSLSATMFYKTSSNFVGPIKHRPTLFHPTMLDDVLLVWTGLNTCVG